MKDLEIIQRNELMILKEIKRICDKHNIVYYLSSGTLLGAIRHKGFIPWDDDIDVEMPLSEYKKFLKICENELNERFFLQTFETDLMDQQSFAKIRMNNTTFVPLNHTRHKIHHGFWVDIFPVIRLPKSKLLFNVKRNIVRLASYMQAEGFMLDNYDEFIDKLGKPAFNLIMLIHKLPIKFRVLLHKFLLKFILKEPKKDKSIGILWMSITRIPKNVYCELITAQFEDDIYPIPANYDEYLTSEYGDYMELPPESERYGHGGFIVDDKNSYETYMQL